MQSNEALIFETIYAAHEQIQYEIFICEKVEPQTLTLRLDRRRGLVRDWNDSILIFKEWNLNPE